MTTNRAERRHLAQLLHLRPFVAAVVLAVVGGLGAPSGAAAATPAWVAPVEPLVVVQGFDPPAGPYGAGHRGVDLAGYPGQPVHAAADGVVSYAGKIAGIGVVAVVHGRIRTTYQPLEVTTARGTPVAAGDALGRLVPVGSHCAPDPCLHWGAIVNEVYVDPLQLLNPGPSRLLPYWNAGARLAGPVGSEHTVAPATDVAVVPWARGAAPAAEVGSLATAGFRLAEIPVATDGPLASRPAAPAQDGRPLTAGVALAIAGVGGLLAGGLFLAVRRRSR